MIKDAFMGLYARKQLHEISVKEICLAAGIARTTFYNYYFDIYELLENIETELINGLKRLNKGFASEPFQGITAEDFHFFDATFDYVREHRLWFRTLLDRDRDSQFIYKWRKIIKDDFRNKFRADKFYMQSEDITLSVISSATIAIFTYWVNTDTEIPKETIIREVVYPFIHEFI